MYGSILPEVKNIVSPKHTSLTSLFAHEKGGLGCLVLVNVSNEKIIDCFFFFKEVNDSELNSFLKYKFAEFLLDIN